MRAVLDAAEPGALADREGQLLGTVVGDDDDLAGLVGVLDADATGRLRDRRLALGLAGLEQLDHTRQTFSDVVCRRHATGVERTHGQLRAGLTDRLGRDDADRLSDVDELAGRERTAVALGAGTGLRVAGEDRAHLDLVDAGLDELVDEHVADVVATLGQHVAGLGVLDVDGQVAGVGGGLDVLVLDDATVVELDADDLAQATLGAAVVLTDDDVLRHVDETTREVAGVGRPQRGVGETLAGAVRRDEVLEHRQTLAEVRLDRARDDLALRVGHQTTHTGDLADLSHVSASARVDDHVDRVGLLERRLHRLRDLDRGGVPDLDELLATLLVGDQAPLVLLLDLRGLSFS